jgi:hypothetical protein
MFKSFYTSLLSQSPRARTFAPSERRTCSDTSSGSNSTSESSTHGAFRLADRELSFHPHQSSLSHVCTLPASTSRFKIPQALTDEQLESIQARCSKWKKEVVTVRRGITTASRVWVTIDDKDYMMEEVSGNGLTEAFVSDGPIHMAVLLILTAMTRANINACYVWNLPGARSSGPGRDICMRPRSYKPRPV